MSGKMGCIFELIRWDIKPYWYYNFKHKMDAVLSGFRGHSQNIECRILQSEFNDAEKVQNEKGQRSK